MSFQDIHDLHFRDIDAEVRVGCFNIQLRSLNQNPEESPGILLDEAEAMALRDWLNRVLA